MFIWLAIRIVNTAAPNAIAVEEFFEVVLRSKRFISVGSASARKSGTFAPFERERFKPFDARAAAEARRATVLRRQFRITPEQQTLCPGPDAVKYAVGPFFMEEIAVAVAKESTGAGA